MRIHFLILPCSHDGARACASYYDSAGAVHPAGEVGTGFEWEI